MFYIHDVPGMVRIISEPSKKNPPVAGEVRKGLSTLAGVCAVHINLTAGTILSYYNPKAVTVINIVDICLRERVISIGQRVFQTTNILERAFHESG